jgi:hypothetical protein
MSTPGAKDKTLAAVSDLGSRSVTRLMCIFSLTNRLPTHLATAKPLSNLMIFGRFGRHVAASDSILPKVIHSGVEENVTVRAGENKLAAHVLRIRTLLAITPRSDAVLLFEMDIDAEESYQEIASTLAQTCFQRDDLMVDDEPLLRRVERVLLAGAVGEDPLSFGLDVHQIVFPSNKLQDSLRADFDESVSNIVFRGTTLGAGAMRKPAALNYGGHAFAAHGRGVSVLAGWANPVENVIIAIATTIVSTLGVVQRTKRSAFSALVLNENAMLRSPGDARELISGLADRLMIMQLDLSFGVEAFLDSVLIPELIVESFQTSLCDALGTTDALRNTSRMLERLQSVISARLTALVGAVQSRIERRGKIFSGVGLLGTILALPPAMLLSFFGVNATNVDDSASIFDFDRYWPAYITAWGPFVILATVGWSLLRFNKKPAKTTLLDRAHTADNHLEYELRRDHGRREE